MKDNNFYKHVDAACKEYPGLRYLDHEGKAIPQQQSGAKAILEPGYYKGKGQNRSIDLETYASSLHSRFWEELQNGLMDREYIYELVLKANRTRQEPYPEQKIRDNVNQSYNYIAGKKEEEVKKKEEEAKLDSYIDDLIKGSTTTNADNDNSSRGPHEDFLSSPPPSQQVEEEWMQKIPNQDYVKYIVDIIKRTVKCEDELIHHIVYTILSKDTAMPLNLAVLAPTGEGKTYAIVQSCEPFKHDPNVIIVGSMSPKFLAHDYGYTIDKHGNKIDKRIKELKRAMDLCGHSKKDKKNRVDAKEQLEALLEDSRRVVDLAGKCLIFLDAPNKDLWETIKPILSHDATQSEFNYVDPEIKSIKGLIKGWPAVIFASARDESKWDQWDEIANRFITASPNMVEAKYKASNKLMFQKVGLPKSTWQKKVVSDEEEELAKKCAIVVKSYLQQWTDGLWIPYQDKLSDCVPDKRGVDTRLNQKIVYLSYIIPLLHSNHRLKLHKGNEHMVIASLSDLLEVLKLTRNLTEISPHKKEFYDKYIVKVYQKEGRPIIPEEICKFYKEKTGGREMLPETLRKNILYELVRYGILDGEKPEEFDTKRDKRKTYYTPLLIEDSNSVCPIPNLLCKCHIFTSNTHNYTNNEREFWLYEAFYSEEEIRKSGIDFWVSSTQGQRISDEQFFYEYTHEQLDPDTLNLLGLKGACVQLGHFSNPDFQTLQEDNLDSVSQKEADLASNFGNATLLRTFYEAQVTRNVLNTMICNSQGQIQGQIMANAGPIEPIGGDGGSSVGNIIEPIADKAITNDTGKRNAVTQLIPKSKPKSTFEEEILPILDKAVGMDLEWSRDRKKGVYCACFYPVNKDRQQPITLHLEDFGYDQEVYVTKIIEIMESFSFIMGHNIVGHDSDFYKLKRMAYRSTELRERIDLILYLDTHKLFENSIVSNMLSPMGIDYPSLSLNDIAESFLGEGKGKFGGLTGADIEGRPREEREQYCMQDAKLVVEILQHKIEHYDWEVLRVLHSITEPTGMSFLNLCSSSSSKIFASMKSKNGYSNVMCPDKYKNEKIEYAGGFVHPSEIGIHRGVITLDFKGLYPSIIIANNISSETINCKRHSECVEQGKFEPQIMQRINDGLLQKKQQPINEWWWTCVKATGIYPKIQRKLIQERDEYKAVKNIIFAMGRKLLSNGSYGGFQLKGYEFMDQRVGFLITAIGRMMITEVINQAPKYGYKVIAGDTDSVFLKPIPGVKQRLDEFKAYASKKFNAELAVDKEWDTICIEDEKSYYGFIKSGKFVRKKMWGLRASNTLLQKRLMSKLVNKQILELYNEDPEKARQQILNDLKPIFAFAAQDLEKNEFHFTASKHLKDYDKDGFQRELYLERTEEGLPCGKGIRYSYYKIDPVQVSDGNGGFRKKKYTAHPEKYLLNNEKIIEGLTNCVNTILENFGIDIGEVLN